MIVIDRLSVKAGSFSLQDVSLELPTGVYGVLMGRTGSGKTTLIEAICGLKPITSGRIHLQDRDVTHLPPAARGIGYVPQDLALFPELSVRDHLAFSLEVRRWPRARKDERVHELAQLLGIQHLLERNIQSLSGGESQRVGLGRALAFHPRILLLDEPLSALDEHTRGEMTDLLRGVQKKTGLTTLHITHSKWEANRLADRLFQLEPGGIREIAMNSGKKGQE